MTGREQVIAALQAAFVQGRLTKKEFDLRVSRALAMYAELDALTADIPAAPPAVKAEPTREAANKKMIQQGTASIAGMTFLLVATVVMPRDPVAGAIAGVLITFFVSVLSAGLLTLLSWAMDRRAGAKGTGGAQPAQGALPGGADQPGGQPERGQDPPGMAARADIVTKSRAHHGSKKVHGPCLVVARSLLPLRGAARPRGLAGA